jgi:AcrR family transcriptional regulator
MASNKKAQDRPKRPYRKKLRARRMEETRRRIVEALVELHGSVGPARTKVSEVAQRAGVRRMTVYNHFPTELEMIDACSSHWVAAHPPPDPEEWAHIASPEERVRHGLAELYRYYRRNRGMVGNFVRDAPLVPALAQVMKRKWFPRMERMADVLTAGSTLARDAARRRRAALQVALSFVTWSTLADAGLADAAAAETAADMVAAAGVERPTG